MVTAFYFVVFAVSIFMTASILFRYKKVDTVFMLTCIFVTINCFGRYMIASSQALEMAVWANKFMYLGACFTPLTMVFVIEKLTKKILPKAVNISLIIYSVAIMGCVMTIGKNGLYYKHVKLIAEDGYHYLQREYGPAHVFYPLLMLIYAGILIYYIVYAIKRKNDISISTIATICVTGIIVIVFYILELITKSKISFLAVGYLIGMVFLTKNFDRLNMYDITTNIVNSMDKLKEYGYMVIDDKYRFISSNDYLKVLFPEIENYIVDREIPPSESYFYTEIIQYVRQMEKRHKISKLIHVKNRDLQLTVRILYHGRRRNVGYLLEFVDRTIEMKYYHTIEVYNEQLEKQVAEKTENIIHIKDMMVLGMAEMVENRDSSTGGHIKRTSLVVKVFAEKLKDNREKFGFTEDFLEKVEKAAPMHDLGKIAVDDEVLRKPGKYTEEEYNKMKKHSANGAKIVKSILTGVEDEEFVVIATNVAHYHHEKYDGTGYPDGLKGEDIPIEARIMALADVFDALVSKRCYKLPFSYDKAFMIIHDSLGKHFDPELGEIFIQCRGELEKLYNGFLVKDEGKN